MTLKRKLIILAIVILMSTSGCDLKYFDKTPEVEKTTVVDCNFGGELRAAARRNIEFSDDIRKDIQSCIVQLSSTQLWKEDPIRVRNGCIYEVHSSYGGVSPVTVPGMEEAKDLNLLPAIYDSIAACGGN